MKKEMKPLLALTAFAAIVVVFGFRRAGDSSSTDLAQLKKINARFIHNFVTNDTASHNKILHRDFVLITPKGGKVGRRDYLNAWAHGFDVKTYYYWDYRDEQISIFGNAALVRSVTKYTKLVDGKEVPVMTRYTDTYIKEGDEWRCVQAQLTSVTEENFPGDETIVRKYLDGKIQ